MTEQARAGRAAAWERLGGTDASQGEMELARRDLWGRVSGILFAALSVAGLVLLFNLPFGGHGRSDETVRSFYEDAGNRTRVVIAAYALAFAGLAFIVFLTDLYGMLRSVEAPPGRLSLAVLAAGIAFVALLFAGAAALGAVASGMSLGGEPGTLGDTGVARFLAAFGLVLLLLYGGLAAAFMVSAVSLLGRKAKALPGWLVWGGFAVALVLLAGAAFMPIFVLPLWVVAVSLARLRRRETATVSARE